VIKVVKFSFCILFVAGLFSGCRYLNPNIMLRTPRNYVYDTFPAVVDSQYVIAVDDQVSFTVQANDGINLVDIFQGISQQGQGFGNVASATGLSFAVEFDGTVKLPIIGRLKIAGLTPRQTEDSLEFLFSKLYKDPFVRVNVSNRRVLVFPGGIGTAKVVPLTDQNMTLFEALAFTGGIDANGKAYRIKLIRGNLKRPYIFLIDASTLQSFKEANLVLQADDIIYVEPIERPWTFFTREVLPWVGAVTSTAGIVISVYTLTRLF
jgi:polysaccharide export outer membrane protein